MALSLAKLRRQARLAGVPTPVVRGATSAEELKDIIADHTAHENGRERTKPRKKVKTAARSTRRTASKTGRTSVPARKSAKTGEAKRRSTATRPSKPRKPVTRGGQKRTATKPRESGYVPKGGRNTLDGVNFTVTDGWNPRKGSAPDLIIRALRKFRGDRAKVFDHLWPSVGTFVSNTKRNGQKRTTQEKRDMLEYRIARTAWQFAVQTGQHEVAENRVTYGTGGTGNGNYKPVKKNARASKPAAKPKPKAKPSRTSTARPKRAATKPARATRATKPSKPTRATASRKRAQVRARRPQAAKQTRTRTAQARERATRPSTRSRTTRTRRSK